MAVFQVFDQVKAGVKAAKNTIMQVTEPERMVKDATNMEKWGPSGTQMREIAQATFSYQDYPILIDALFKRLSEPGKYWRHVYKALLVIDYILKNGSDEVVQTCRERLIEIQTLTHFQQIDEEDGKDVGLNVRERAKVVLELINDDDRLKDERDRASAARSKFVGVSNDDSPSFRSGSSSFGSGDRYASSSSRDESYDYRYDDDRKAEREREQQQREQQERDRAAAAAAAAKPKPQEAPKTSNLLDFGGASAAQPARPAATSFFDMAPAPQAAPAQQSGSFFGGDFDPRGNAAARPQPQAAPAQDFFAAPAAAAPVQQPMQQQFFAQPQQQLFAAAPAPVPTQAALAPQQSSAAFGSDSFGDFAAAPASDTDPWKSGLVNLDNLDKKGDPRAASAARSKVPMAAMGSTGPVKPVAKPIPTTMAPQQQYNMMQPGMMQPGMMQPGMMQPGMMQPGMMPGMMQPGMMQPGMMQPGMMQPGMMQPGMMQPGMMQPGMMQPGMMQPGMYGMQQPRPF